MKNSAIFFLLFASTWVSGQNKYDAYWKSLDFRPLPAWFEDAKLGIFIHLGIYSVPSWGPTKTMDYEQYAERYWSRLFDTKATSYKLFVDYLNKNFGEQFRYQDFVRDFTCEMFDPEPRYVVPCNYA